MPRQTFVGRRALALVLAVASVATLFVAGASPSGAAVPTEAPTIVSPDGGTVGANPVLLWEPIDGVVRYRVQVSASASFSSAIWSNDVHNVSATPTGDLPLGTLYWRVAGMDGTSVGPYSVATFTRSQAPGPQLLAPVDGSRLDHPSEPVILRWEAVPGVKSYKVEVDDAADFIGAQTIVTDSTSWALLNTQPLGQTFYWRVQGQGSASGVNTQYSETWSYTLDWAADGSPLVPTLTEPADGATVTDVVFRWDAVPGAARYQIQVSPNGDWANNVTIDQTVKGTSYSPPVTLNNASYFWRVRALSVRTPADAGPWSGDGRQFTRSWSDVPALEAPADLTTSADPFLLQWDPVPYASAYEVQVGTDLNFSPGTYQTCTTTHTDWAPYWRESTDPALPPRPGTCLLADNLTHRGTYTRHGVRYYWRVRGLDQSQPNVTPTVLGRFSDVRSFEYLPSGAALPIPTSPADGSTVSVPRLSWTPVRGAERYEVRIWRNGTGAETFITWGTSITPSLALTGAGPTTITWTVRSLTAGINPGSLNLGAGPTVTGPAFTLEHTEPGEGATPVLVSPGPGDEVVQPDFDWTPVDGAGRYEVRLCSPGSPVCQVLGDHNEPVGSSRHNPHRSAFTPTQPVPPGAYEWEVVARTSEGTFLSTSPRRAITISSLPVAQVTAPAVCTEGGTCEPEASTPLLRWDPVPGAGLYRVHIALDPEFTNVRHVYTTTQAALRPTEALPDNQAGQSYYWFVQPCRSITVCGRFNSSVFGTAGAFRKQSPPIALTSPADGAQVADLVTFSWAPPSSGWDAADGNDDVEARHYRIQVSTRSDFASLLDTAEVDQTTYTPHAKTYPEGPLYWRVQARDGSGNYLTFSPERVVHKSSPYPVITSPAAGDEVNGVPVVQWEAQPFAAGYQVEYYRNGDTSWTPTNKVQTTTTQLAADTMLKHLPLGTYAYRVRRVDVDGLFGPWSSDAGTPGSLRTFEVVGGTPSPTAPANGTVYSRSRVRLEWDPVPGAVQYRVETSATAGFASLIENQVTVMTAFSTMKLYPNGTIYWRVRALDAQGNVTGTSPVRTYVHDLTRPSAAVSSVTAGPASALVRWTASPVSAVGPITSFVVTPYVGSTRGTPVTVPGSAREVRVTGLVNDTRHRFTVTPYDENGVGTESPKSSEVIPRKVSPFTSTDRFIDRQFRDLYGRAPTSAEKTTWRTALQGSTTPEGMIQSLWDAPPHASIMPTLMRLYSAFYLRIPDHSGLDYWSIQRRSGKSVAAAAEFFARSSEFKSRYGTLANPEYVDLVYANVLGRAPSTKDRNYWTAELAAGRRTRGTLMIGFSESAEYRTKFQHEINAGLVLLEMLDRTPTRAERDLVAGLLRGGTSLRAIFVLVMAMPEYAARAT